MVNGQSILNNLRDKLKPETLQHISNIWQPPTAVKPVPEEVATGGRKVERVTLATLDTSQHEVKTAVKAARAWKTRKAEFPKTSLVLCGNYGTGKTHIAKSILWSICYVVDDKPVAPIGQFFMANDLIQLMKAGNSPRELLGLKCPILVIDDVGSEQNIEYIKADRQDKELEGRYLRVVDYCDEHGISIIVTSNLDPN
jgi:chromosomal replication initiation ATPase DnaA